MVVSQCGSAYVLVDNRCEGNALTLSTVLIEPWEPSPLTVQGTCGVAAGVAPLGNRLRPPRTTMMDVCRAGDCAGIGGEVTQLGTVWPQFHRSECTHSFRRNGREYPMPTQGIGVHTASGLSAASTSFVTPPLGVSSSDVPSYLTLND